MHGGCWLLVVGCWLLFCCFVVLLLHRSPVRGPTAVPYPYEYEQQHEESEGTDHAVWYDPFLTRSPAAERAENTPSPAKDPGPTIPPGLSVFPVVFSQSNS